jgi:spermidine synthase
MRAALTSAAFCRTIAPSLRLPGVIVLDRLLIGSVFIVATCGLAYELVAAALASYLLGDSILQFSSIIGTYLFAMGIGSFLAQYVKGEQVLQRFIEVELLVGLIGGVSAALLFGVFAVADLSFRPVLYALVLIIGALVGMEIPLVMRVLHERKAEFKALVSRVLTFDYLGALAVSLLFPLLLAPQLGLVRTAFLFGLLNAGVAVLTAYAFRHELAARTGTYLRASGVIALLVLGFAASDLIVRTAESRVYGPHIVHTESTPYQRLLVTRWRDDTRLYLNGNLQFSSRDEHRYHEALVHPALAALPWAKSVLILGGGDGLAAREALKYHNVERITLVDLDPGVTRLFATAAPLRQLNADALRDTRVTVVNEDAARWLEGTSEVFDAAIIDLPDPSNFSLGKLYTVSFYQLLARHVAERGLIALQATSPYHAPQAYWSIERTLREAGLATHPYHVHVPSFGSWGFIVAAKHRGYRVPERFDVPLKFLSPQVAQQLFVFPPDMPRPKVEANRLDSQVLVKYFQDDWSKATE